MANQVSVAESIARMSTVGFELAQQLYAATEEDVRNNTEETNTLRSQLQNLDMLLETMRFDEMSHLYALLQVQLFSTANAS
jgi:regulatory protein YycI of two-component signal transduction system YycFG